VSQTATPRHPLDALTGAEILAAVARVRTDHDLSEAARFAYIGLDEPTKGELAGFDTGTAVGRRVRLVIVDGPASDLIEAVVDLDAGRVTGWDHHADLRPALLFEESLVTIVALIDHPEWKAALARRGITDPAQVQIDPWPAGGFGIAHEDGRRITRCLAYYREHPEDNGYARPLEGLLAVVDMARGEVLEVIDLGVVDRPPDPGAYRGPDAPPPRTDLRPVVITQPEGVSFTLDGNHLAWQRWSLRVTMDPYEGLVLHTIGYRDGGRLRPIVHRASISEMVVPYGHPGPMHNWKNAFDVGEWGLGRMANSLTLGCDCLGEIRYLDVDFATETGGVHTLANAICIHEEDYGIGWKHADLHAGTTEVRRSRRLVISSISTVGNYEYGFFWYLYLDGTISLEVKLTGIMSTMAVAPGEAPDHASLVAPQLAAPYHQHLFSARLDLDVDGAANTVYEVDAVADPLGPDNPLANTFGPRATALDHESVARRNVDPARSRTWKVVNPHVRNALGQPVAYKLVPQAVPTLLAGPTSSVARRAGFATANLWVTPYRADERRAAGDHPNQHLGGAGLPAWTAADRALDDRDVVLWHTFGVTHIPRPEDWPVMPVEYTGFSLVPVGFFDRNPALDVPASPGHGADHCA
jgi:primary-amine oxidase